MTKTVEQKLLEIAKAASYSIEQRGDLEPRYWDSEDFIELSVTSIKEMLEQAYQLGKGDK